MRRIGIINNRLVGKAPGDLSENREAAYSRIEYTD
jgi:hypothetical protein